jgi:hypothetical protein
VTDNNLEQAKADAKKAKSTLHAAQTAGDTKAWSDAALANTKARENLTRAKARAAEEENR